MPWFAVHCVFYIRVTDGLPQDRYCIEENVLLVRADSFDSAKVVGAELAKANYTGSDEGLSYESRPAEYVFIGIRKAIECLPSMAALTGHDTKVESGPEHGTELTYSFYVTRDVDSMKAFASGASATLECDE